MITPTLLVVWFGDPAWRELASVALAAAQWATGWDGEVRHALPSSSSPLESKLLLELGPGSTCVVDADLVAMRAWDGLRHTDGLLMAPALVSQTPPAGYLQHPPKVSTALFVRGERARAVCQEAHELACMMQAEGYTYRDEAAMRLALDGTQELLDGSYMQGSPFDPQLHRTYHPLGRQLPRARSRVSWAQRRSLVQGGLPRSAPLERKRELIAEAVQYWAPAPLRQHLSSRGLL